MTFKIAFTFLLLGLAKMQANAALVRAPVVTGVPAVAYSPLVEALPTVVDFQALTALSCGCGPTACGCGPITVDCRIPTSVSPVVTPACGCGVPSCGCGVPTAAYRAPYPVIDAGYTPYPVIDAGYTVSSCGSCGGPACGCGVPACGCGVPACGCGVPALTTPLTPPFAPVIGCTKYLRQVCVQPPFL